MINKLKLALLCFYSPRLDVRWMNESWEQQVLNLLYLLYLSYCSKVSSSSRSEAPGYLDELERGNA